MNGICMKMRQFACKNCGTAFSTTSPNAKRCEKCAKLWQAEYNRKYQSKLNKRYLEDAK